MDEVLFGFHPVREALRARRRRLVVLLVRAGPQRGDRADLLRLAREAGVAIEEASPEALAKVAGPDSRTQGLVLVAGPIPEPSLDELLAPPPGAGPLLALDGVEDPQNFGAILRAADAAGARGVLVTRRRAPPLQGAVGRASAGALEHVPVTRVPNLVRALGEAREAGFWTLGADSSEGEPLFESPDRLWEGKLLVVLGAEGRGLRTGVRKQLDHRVRIPMQGQLDSMNVASAASVILFEALRRRNAARG